MLDLYAGVLIMGLLSGLLFRLAQRLWDEERPVLTDVLAVATVVATILYGFLLRDEIFLGRLLPFSNVLVLSNWFPLAASFLAGIAWNRVPGAPWRKAISTWALLGIAIYSAIRPITGVAPLCANEWREGICLQTSPMTCSPASAATLLAHYGIQADEQEMAELCLTRKGTTWQGLYHGLSVKLRGSQKRVEVLECNAEQLRQMATAPMILSVELKLEDAGQNLVYESKWGWQPNVPHTVVLLGFDRHGIAVIGEPSFGIDYWRPKDLDILWHGRVIRIVPR